MPLSRPRMKRKITNAIDDEPEPNPQGVQEVLGELQEQTRRNNTSPVTDENQKHTGQITRDVFRD
jgi:hypothetical protein